MNRPPTLLFDLDGCLVDSTVAITSCVNHALEAIGLPSQPLDALRWCIGPPLRPSFEQLLAAGGMDPSRATECVDVYRDRYEYESLVSTVPVDGVVDVLENLSTRHRLAIVTSKPARFAAPILEKLDLLRYFEDVFAPPADHGVEEKAVTLARALSHLEVEAARAVMIGDRFHDVEAGRANGTNTVGVTWGVGDRAELESAGADHVVDAPPELLVLWGR